MNSILWHEDEDGETMVVTPQPGQRLRIQLPPTHHAEPSRVEDGAIEVIPAEGDNGPTG